MAASLIPHASLYLIGTIVFTVIAGVAVLARFASRWKLRQIPLGPDWLSLISLLILFAQAALFINLIEKYGALDLDPPSPFDAIAELVTDTWVEQFLFTSVITSVELGILWFYYILFHVDCHIRWAILVTGTVCILWLIITFILLVVLKQQSPGLLDIDNGTLPQFLFVFELINLFIDVIILCIPIRAVIGLQLPRPKKVAVFIIFLLGFL
ncbi:hypothetical protein GGR50DRAFT_693137 [Xylaria sp. CBS 124048]|nr:hypothetical protein GGR50DRAFT_693137 [Xylaria sp. CBS 124048]